LFTIGDPDYCMPKLLRSKNMKWTLRIVGSFVFLASASLIVPAAAFAQSTILLQGVVSAQCSIVVTSLAAASALPLTTSGAQRIEVGTVLQNCNKKTGYNIVVTSANCATPTPAGAKVLGSAAAYTVPYSVEFDNSATGGSQTTVTGLLATVCTAAVGRGVTSALIVAETSTVWVNYTGVPLLAADTYLDTLTIVMNVN
jgi:hypothetical protein